MNDNNEMVVDVEESVPTIPDSAPVGKVKKRFKFSFSKLIIYIILILWSVTTIFPFFWAINNSFKDRRTILPFETSFLLCVDPRMNSEEVQKKYAPENESPTLANYEVAFRGTINVGKSYINSIVISGTVTVAVVVLAGFAAFGLVRYKFKGSWIFNVLILASMMFPGFSTIIPVLSMMTNMGLTDSPISVILPQIAGNLSFGILVLMGSMRALPIDLEEAAFMEGCNVYQIFWRIILPISKPSLSTVAIFSFLWSYNDLFVQKVMIKSRDKYPICMILSYISSDFGTDYGLMAAAVAIVVVPVLIIYIFLQKNIVKGLTAGAVKG